jgi:hypothetical protein
MNKVRAKYSEPSTAAITTLSMAVSVAVVKLVAHVSVPIYAA